MPTFQGSRSVAEFFAIGGMMTASGEQQAILARTRNLKMARLAHAPCATT